MSTETWIEITDGDPEGYEETQDEHETREEPNEQYADMVALNAGARVLARRLRPAIAEWESLSEESRDKLRNTVAAIANAMEAAADR